LTIKVVDALGNPIENLDVRRRNLLDACLIESFDPLQAFMGSYCPRITSGNESIDFRSVRAFNDIAVPSFQYSFGPVYPTPFYDVATIQFALAQQSFVTLDILNWKGKRIRRLGMEVVTAGLKIAGWDAKDDHGITVSDGVYTCHIVAQDFDSGSDVLEDSIACVFYGSIDIHRCPVIGRTSSSGIFQTGDIDLFPYLHGHDRTICVNPDRDTIGTCAFIDTVSIFVTYSEMIPPDSYESYIGISRKVGLTKGKNSFTFTWVPEDTF
jgi:hypothetical protein